ncbi:MAG: DUF6186 family protein [Actinomycetota bacterium]
MSARSLTLLGWAVLAVGFVALEVRALVRRDRFATVGDALDVLLRTPAARVLLLLGWLWLGWHVFVR